MYRSVAEETSSVALGDPEARISPRVVYQVGDDVVVEAKAGSPFATTILAIEH